MYTNWEQIENGTGCPVPDANADGTVPGPVEGECTLGGMASFVVNASSVAMSLRLSSSRRSINCGSGLRM